MGLFSSHEQKVRAILDSIVANYDEFAEYAKSNLNDVEQNRLSQILLIIAARLSFQSDERKNKIFDDAEKFGVHFLPVHFYSPIPSINEIDKNVYNKRYDKIPGLNISRDIHLNWLNTIVPYAQELTDVPAKPDEEAPVFNWQNPAFPPGDAILYYGMIRHLRPKRIIEIGGGYSTLLAAKALARNGQGELTCIEPYPMPKLRALVAQSEGMVNLIDRKIQEVEPAIFEQLSDKDILFIDSSHVSKAGSDVNHEVFEIFPRIASGVWCHVHDIFFPWDYAKYWIEDLKIFWNEQYLIMAFLAYNKDFKLEISNQYVGRELQDSCARLFAATGQEVFGGGSLWFRRE